MNAFKAVVFDFIGTLVDLVDYSLKASEEKMLRSLIESGFQIGREEFFEAYRSAYKKYKKIRYGQLVEVTNAIWISEALSNLGSKIDQQGKEIKKAVKVFFKDYVKALRLRENAKTTLQELASECKLGVISNFTYSPAIYNGLRKLDVDGYFDIVLVSEAVGWRKPNPKIFQEALRQLNVKAAEAVFVGDTPLEDIQGAKSVGMKAVFIPSQFNSLDDMHQAVQQPDGIIRNLNELLRILHGNSVFAL